MLAPLPLHEGPELQFPTEGDVNEDLGDEEGLAPFFIPSLQGSADETMNTNESATAPTGMDTSASEPGGSAMERG